VYNAKMWLYDQTKQQLTFFKGDINEIPTSEIKFCAMMLANKSGE